eukprot:1533945-Rhodomonas_salina.5
MIGLIVAEFSSFLAPTTESKVILVGSTTWLRARYAMPGSDIARNGARITLRARSMTRYKSTSTSRSRTSSASMQAWTRLTSWGRTTRGSRRA